VLPHLALSDDPAEDLIKFVRFLERHHGRKFLNVTAQALDVGCGNGRNLIYLSETFGMRGLGYDISQEAIAQAKKKASALPLQFSVRSLVEPVPLPDSSVTLALDMMSSHVLKQKEREKLRDELCRVLKQEGWLFFKSFLLEEDAHAKRLLREFPAEEEGMYIHPEIGTAEYVWTENALRDFFEPHFTIHKIEKSHKHQHADGTAWKRRTISAYLSKN
jgi:ubiquinone/menaquinone biosynthesis C-methylase UbiE